MAYLPLTTLIDKTDNVEIIRDQIGVILVEEIANQQVLAVVASQDPSLYNLKVYIERHNPIEDWLNLNPESTNLNDFVPRVNISFDQSSVQKNASDTVKTQRFVGTFNIDVYGLGIAQDTVEGHDPADKKSVLEAQRALRLVRNILMASTNAQLQLPTIVGDRMSTSLIIKPLKPDMSGVQQITAGRLTLDVGYRETSPQFVGGIVEEIFVDVHYAEDGSLLAAIELDLT